MGQEVHYDEYHWMQLQWLDDIYVISHWLCADFYMQSMQHCAKNKLFCEDSARCQNVRQLASSSSRIAKWRVCAVSEIMAQNQIQ